MKDKKTGLMVKKINGASQSVVIYQSSDGKLRLEVQLQNETIWLTQAQIAALLGVNVPGISKYINNIYEEGELEPVATLSKMETVQTEGSGVFKGRQLGRKVG